MLTPWAILGLRGDAETRESEAKFAGRILAYNPSAFRRARRPCSGRTGLLTPHFGPPTEPGENQRVSVKKKKKAVYFAKLTHQNGIGLLTCFQSNSRQGFTDGIYGVSSKCVRFQLEFERSRSIRDSLEDLDGFRNYFWPCIVSKKPLVRCCPESSTMISTNSIARQDGDTKAIDRSDGGQPVAIRADERPKQLTLSWTS